MKPLQLLSLLAFIMFSASCKKDVSEPKQTTETAQSSRPADNIIKSVTDLEVGDSFTDIQNDPQSEQDYWDDNLYALIIDWDIHYPHLEQANFPPLFHIQFGILPRGGWGSVFSTSFTYLNANWSYEHLGGSVGGYEIHTHGNLVLVPENKSYFVTTRTFYISPTSFQSFITFTRNT